ncbi:hypothetical protein [Nocardiopsis composta]|uniref:Ribonuclease BN (tRNA processing enzyme) n=1 Tax=Nocardiopsis composta TaxID=157465 RepID=A0A7W8QPE5_9ACTN|nr:hypothetical protein [Nocardiopsis composta]MBB5433724.1 ribonuclease BN (tRNA processing enzyme) [Nocardiopsis composta]
MLLCEADLAAEAEGEAVHLTPEQAGAAAAKGGAGHLLLTHLGPALSAAEAVRRAAGVFPSGVSHADPGRSLTIG